MDSEGLPSGDPNTEGNEFIDRRRSRDVDELDQRRQKVRRSSFTRRSSHNFDQDRRRSKDGSRPPSVQRSRSVERSMDVEHSPSPVPQITSPSGKSPTTPDSAISAAAVTLDTALVDRQMRHQPLKNKSSSSSDLGHLVEKDKQFHTLPSMRRHKRMKDLEVSVGRSLVSAHIPIAVYSICVCSHLFTSTCVILYRPPTHSIVVRMYIHPLPFNRCLSISVLLHSPPPPLPLHSNSPSATTGR